MPPAFNLSQDQTLEFDLSRLVLSNLLINGIDIHWLPNGYLLPCEHLIFPRTGRQCRRGTRLQDRLSPAHRAWRFRPDAHTYRLLIFKDRDHLPLRLQ